MKFKEWLKKHFPDKEKELAELDEPEIQKPDTPPANPVKSEISPEIKTLVDTMKAENDKLLTKLAEFEKKETDREKLLSDQAKADAKTKIEAAIKKAIEDKKIPAKDEATIATYTKLFELDFDNTSKVITALPVIAGEKKPGEKTNVKGIEVKGPFNSVDKTILKAVNEMATSQN